MLKQWLSKYSSREQAIIIGLCVLVLIWFVYLFLLNPFLKYQTRIQQDTVNQQETLLWMQNAVKEYRQLSGSQSGGMGSSGSVVVILESLISQAQLGNPQRIEPNGNNKAMVEFDNVPFDQLIALVGNLSEQSGIVLTQANIKRTKTSGVVAATLTLERTGS